jgi:hypothetical protein
MKTSNGKKSTSLILALVLLALPGLAQAQAFRGNGFRGGSFENGFGMKGIDLYGGAGFADFDVKSPSANFRMDQGIYAFIGGQRAVNESGLSVTISFSYMTSEGQSFYSYSTLGGVTYSGTDIGFDNTNYQLGLGLKQQFFPQGWFRPYIEGGGLFGYHEIKYTSRVSTISMTGSGDPNGFKRSDGLIGFGYYGEAGLEIDFSDNYGIKVGGRYQHTTTRSFETLADQRVKFETLVFLLGMMIRI